MLPFEVMLVTTSWLTTQALKELSFARQGNQQPFSVEEELALIQREVSLAFLQRHHSLYWCVPHVHTLQATVLVKMHSSYSAYPVLLFASKALFLSFALRPV